MNRNVILTCAVTGSGDSHLKHPHVPSTPEEIAASAVAAAKAGASVVHLHVREADGTPCRKLEYYQETVRLIRESGVDVIINLTTGMGGDYVEDPDDPTIFGPGSDMVGPAERVRHVEAISPTSARWTAAPSTTSPPPIWPPTPCCGSVPAGSPPWVSGWRLRPLSWAISGRPRN